METASEDPFCLKAGLEKIVLFIAKVLRSWDDSMPGYLIQLIKCQCSVTSLLGIHYFSSSCQYINLLELNFIQSQSFDGFAPNSHVPGVNFIQLFAKKFSSISHSLVNLDTKLHTETAENSLYLFVSNTLFIELKHNTKLKMYSIDVV